MGLGTARTMNWGKEAQEGALRLACARGRVAYQVRTERSVVRLALAASADGLTLPFNECCAVLTNVRRGRWEARHPFDDRLLASGVSQRDVIRATIEAVWR